MHPQRTNLETPELGRRGRELGAPAGAARFGADQEVQHAGARRRGSKPWTPTPAAAPGPSPSADTSPTTPHSRCGPRNSLLGRWERVTMSPNGSSAGSNVRAGRGLLSDSPLCFRGESFILPLEGPCRDPKNPQRARGGVEHRKTVPSEPGALGNADFQTPKEPVDLVTPESLCQSHAKGLPS